MSDQSGYSYDEVPYLGSPIYATHPDCLATLATLLGMKPAPPERSRVLELGCGMGSNILPMAESLPQSQFVALDLSTRQIEAAREVASALGLDNVDFRAQSILDLEEDAGPFDYILCHGVYSWVPAEVQERILAICRRSLAPHGVAYVSYNTYPGWHQRGMAREMLGFHGRQFADPQERVGQARAFLSFVAESTIPPDKPYARILQEELELLRDRPDYYLFHEHLEETNRPLYFHEFAARAAGHGLQYLGEAWHHSSQTRFPAPVRERLRELAGDLIALEQYGDFLINRTFRRTLLVHGAAALNRVPKPDILEHFRIGALARPLGEPSDPRREEVMEFQTEAGVELSTNVPLVKTALLCLFDAWPGALTMAELWQRVCDRLGGKPTEQMHASLAATLLEFYLANALSLHVHMPHFVAQAGTRPIARPHARYHAARGLPVTSLRHRLVALNELDRALLPFLDGRRARADLIQALLQTVSAGKLTVSDKGQPITDTVRLGAVLSEALEPCLFRLGRAALLIG